MMYYRQKITKLEETLDQVQYNGYTLFQANPMFIKVAAASDNHLGESV